MLFYWIGVCMQGNDDYELIKRRVDYLAEKFDLNPDKLIDELKSALDGTYKNLTKRGGFHRG